MPYASQVAEAINATGATTSPCVLYFRVPHSMAGWNLGLPDVMRAPL